MSYILPHVCDIVLLVILMSWCTRQCRGKSQVGRTVAWPWTSVKLQPTRPLRVLSCARMLRLERCKKKILRQRLLCLFILPFLSFGLRYSPRQLAAATELQQSCNRGWIISFISFNWLIWGEAAGAYRHAMDEKFLMSYRFILSQEFENYH